MAAHGAWLGIFRNPSSGRILLVLITGLLSTGGEWFCGTGAAERDYLAESKALLLKPAIYRLAPQWSYDGGRILLPDVTTSSWSEENNMYLVASDGSSLESLPSEIYGPHMSPSELKIAYYTTRHGSKLSLDIETIGLDDSKRRRLKGSHPSSVFPNWSPDGSRIAFAQVDGDTPGIYTMAADGTDVHWLLRFRTREMDNGISDSHYTGPVWSPNGESLAFVVYERTRILADDERTFKERSDAYVLYTMGVEGTHLRRVFSTSTDENQALADMVPDPEWSPDGEKLAQVQNIRSYGKANALSGVQPGTMLYIIESDGSEARLIASLGGSSSYPMGLAWSPNGHEILVSKIDGISMVDQLSGNGRQVAAGWLASYSPDGSRIAVIDPPPSGSGDYMYTIAPDGSDRRVLVRRDANGELKAAQREQ